MTYGIDIYDRYQDITNKLALRDSPYDFAYIKGTDGGGGANVPPDVFVHEIHSIGLPVGLYHYAQLSPSPEQQARVLAEAIRRTGARGLPPALDLEDPHPMTFVSRAFAEKHLLELVRLGFTTVVLYANTSMLNAIRAWELHDVIRKAGGELLIWAANYGNNNGTYDQSDANRLLAAYPHPVWIHQYTSTARVPGIPGNVDGNKMLHQLKGSDMELTDKIRFWDGFEITVGQALADTWQLANNMSDRPTRPNQPSDPPPWLDNFGLALAKLQADVAELKARSVDVDEDALATALIARGMTGGASKEDVKTAVREILPTVRLSANTPGDSPS